jgi:hypothetical protein
MFWVTFAGVVAVVIYAGITAYQALISERTLKVALSQQRAWIKVSDEKIVGPLLVARGGYFVIVRVKLTNIGNVPAIFTQNTLRLLVMPKRIAPNPGAEKGYLTVCPTKPRIPLPNDITIFPGDTAVLPDQSVALFRSDIDRFVGQGDQFYIFVADCVIYHSGSDRASHHTGTLIPIEKPARVNSVLGPSNQFFDPGGPPGDIGGVSLSKNIIENQTD